MKQEEHILSSLLEKGYFPKELPLTFTTKKFGTKIDVILREWQHNGVFGQKNARKLKGNLAHRGAFEYKLQETEAGTLSIPKRGFERRILHITHPVPQALLAREIAKNWRTVQKWLTRSMFSLDRTEISDQSLRALKEINFAAHNEKKTVYRIYKQFYCFNGYLSFLPYNLHALNCLGCLWKRECQKKP